MCEHSWDCIPDESTPRNNWKWTDQERCHCLPVFMSQVSLPTRHLTRVHERHHLTTTASILNRLRGQRDNRPMKSRRTS
uniref:Uncharacterized protein n=1 Tax=Timema poppense TaxID=170557 RepID=A0A7R9DWV3_TIMPO|nr:unnamed protein product [Timema poppensis]